MSSYHVHRASEVECNFPDLSAIAMDSLGEDMCSIRLRNHFVNVALHCMYIPYDTMAVENIATIVLGFLLTCIATVDAKDFVPTQHLGGNSPWFTGSCIDYFKERRKKSELRCRTQRSRDRQCRSRWMQC